MTPCLDVASGYHPVDGCLHFDINPSAPDLDVLGDITALPFRTGSIEQIQAIDCLEHISYRDSEAVLTEWARVLRPGGRIFIQTPDALSMIQWYLSSPARMVVAEFADQPQIVSLSWRLLGGHADDERVKADGDFRWNAHFSLWSRDSLIWYLERVGLAVESIGRNPHPNLQATARKPEQ